MPYSDADRALYAPAWHDQRAMPPIGPTTVTDGDRTSRDEQDKRRRNFPIGTQIIKSAGQNGWTRATDEHLSHPNARF